MNAPTALVLLASLCGGAAAAATLHVAPDGREEIPFASVETAACRVQTAIDVARDGDVIRVAPGRYVGLIDFRGKAVRIVGAGAATILDGAGDGPVVRFARGEDARAQLDSMQITGGRAEDGAGIFVSNASPRLQRLILFANRADNAGAGIYVAGPRAAPLIRNNLVAYNDDSSPALTDAHQIFVDASARAVILNNTIVRGNGNAILLQGSSRRSLVANNLLVWNGSRLASGAPIGRGVCDFSGSARLTANLFWRNVRSALLTDVPGGGLEDLPFIESAEQRLDRARVSGNRDGDPRFRRVPGRRTPAALRPERFRLRAGSPARGAGLAGRAFRNRDGSRNTLGHTGGPLGWR